jgi:prepilin-type N-terminal cleavage/methylation domain-containing protein
MATIGRQREFILTGFILTGSGAFFGRRGHFIDSGLAENYSRPLRSGMSLLELLLVLALLVVIAAIAAPSLERPMEAEKLRRCAQLVQSEWGKARIRAMQSGQTIVFQYQTDSGRYRVQPWYSDDYFLEGNQTLNTTDAAAAPSDQPALAISGELPEGVKFLTSYSLSETRSLEIEEQLASLSNSAGAGEAWSAPVLFFPDGTSSTAETTLVNEAGSYVVVRLRGLTGVSRVSNVLSTGETQ